MIKAILIYREIDDETTCITESPIFSFMARDDNTLTCAVNDVLLSLDLSLSTKPDVFPQVILKRLLL